MFSLTLLLHKPIIIRPLKNLFLPFFFPEKKVIQDFFFIFFLEMVRNNFAINPTAATARTFPNPHAPSMVEGTILPTRAVQDFQFECS